MDEKAALRETLREARRRHVAALPATVQGLVFHRPPVSLVEMIPDNAIIGLYRATPHEAPAGAYARFFFERGHTIALPRFATRNAAMEFAEHRDPYEESDCEIGPFGLVQPLPGASALVPDVLFVPLLGFTSLGDRLGQGGGHYDRWLADHPPALAIGLAWDEQIVEHIPSEDHDMPLSAIVTPTRMYGPFR